MDAEMAMELVKHGLTLLFLDVPQHTLIGIDTQMFSVGPDFKGIKMIPPGPHFVYYSSSTRLPLLAHYVFVECRQRID
ncbi:protein AAR2 homolog [Prunus yedoensis var. nudiflora]|uniref:Protein AAR2 homolog n=1 Tax=Prunus yedoensis var. nudiflora TaxID=2094558 RepID=A0A314UH97_PRUYE|nr:protein AAR2 homolog [Prunus yedoensis var. nudiflora]